MLLIQDVVDYLNEFAPLSLAADWDNVGLLVGDSKLAAARIMTCLTITPTTMEEAIDEQASLIITHHPLPFRPLKQITTLSTTGKLLWNLIAEGVAIHSPHTAFDSALRGINQLWAEELNLQSVKPLEAPLGAPEGTGIGRFGQLPKPPSLQELAKQVANMFELPGVQVVGEPDRIVNRVAIACGSGASILSLAARQGCDLFVTGEASFHSCLEAEALGISMILTGHYASERFGVEELAKSLQQQFPEATIWASRSERDPLTWIT